MKKSGTRTVLIVAALFRSDIARLRNASIKIFESRSAGKFDIFWPGALSEHKDVSGKK